MTSALSKNNDCDSKGLDRQKGAVGDSVTGNPAKERPTDKGRGSLRTYPAKHALRVDFRKVQVDKRTRLGKWMKGLREDLKNDLGGNLTAMEEALLDRIVSKIAQCHLYETGVLTGQDFGSMDFYLAVSNSLRHDLNLIGLNKRVKDPLDLEAYLKGKAEPPIDH
jgi:hypothetical protein